MRGVRKRGQSLQGNDFAAALVWMDGGRAAEQSGVGRLHVQDVVMHVITVSQSVRGGHIKDV